MKYNQLAAAAIVAILVGVAAQAQAAPVAYQFERLNFSLIAQQQGFDNVQTSPNVYVSTLKNFKISTKDLLSFLALAFNTNWPAGSQLAVDNLSGDIFVVARNGVNPVFDVSTGINVGDTNVAYFSLTANPTVFAGKKVVNISGIHRAQTDFGKVFFHLFNEQNGVTNTDLYFDGLNQATTRENIVNTIDNVIGSEAAPVTGDGTFNNTPVVIRGQVIGSGRWNGVPAG